jgi:hypothetical protein
MRTTTLSPYGARRVACSDATFQWYVEATSVWGTLLCPEMRFRTPWVDDELAATIGHARRWLKDNPCPSPRIDRHCVAVLDAYAEMTTATVRRVVELRDIIEDNANAVLKVEWGDHRAGVPVS